MSVFTKVSESELVKFLGDYRLGKLSTFSGIEAGVTNTNYCVVTDQGQYALTLFEQDSHADLPFYLQLMNFLAKHDLPCPIVIAAKHGELLKTLNAKPATLQTWLLGECVLQPSAQQCAQIGDFLGRMHVLTQEFTPHKPSLRGLQWRNATARRVLPRLPADEAALLQEELAFLQQCPWDSLPRGIVHADLFRDNALFNVQQLTGVIDFYYACYDNYLLDLATVYNDWCLVDGREVEQANAQALLQAYQQHRLLTKIEKEYWNAMLRLAAMRFWLSRLNDFYFANDGALVQIKDPQVFKHIVCLHRDSNC